MLRSKQKCENPYLLPVPTSPLPQGDVNGDGKVDVADIACIIDVMAGRVGSGSPATDVNGDGNVDVADIASVIDIMAANARKALQ